MSVKKSKLDLLVRVRYSNPLPAPPCPPKLLDIPTDPMRYARPEFVDALANELPLPMIVDAEMGMPLDLSRWECLWEGDDADDSALNPDPTNLPKLDPKDQFLLGDPAATSAPYANGGTFSQPSAGPPTPATSTPFVPWLRKTEYISREMRTNLSSEPKHVADTNIDVSRPAQIRDIEATFTACSDGTFDLKSIKHPTKPHVTAVESFEVLPDAETWANAYDLFRFAERPGDRPPDVDDPRLDCAILRPMESDGDHFLAYYLTKDDDSAHAFKSKRLQGGPDTAGTEPTAFHFVRDYEVVKVEQDVPNEFLLVLDDGAEADDLYGDANADADAPLPGRRRKGAYYKNIERKMMLKKKRANQLEAYADKWDVVHVAHAPMVREEADERADALAEVDDPLYLLGGTRDADGEPDVDAPLDSVSVHARHVASGFDGPSGGGADMSVDVV